MLTKTGKIMSIGAEKMFRRYAKNPEPIMFVHICPKNTETALNMVKLDKTIEKIFDAFCVSMLLLLKYYSYYITQKFFSQ